MPRATIHDAVANRQEELGIRRRLGQVFLDDQSCNQEDYELIKEYLEELYSVNGANIEYRLKDLGILIDRRSMDKGEVADFFKTE